MSLYDTLYFVNDHYSCAHGHKIEEFQTKSLDCDMGLLLVYGGVFYRKIENQKSEDSYECEHETLIATKRTSYFIENITDTVDFYTSCEACDPVYVKNDLSWGYPYSRHYPWCQFKVLVKNGQIWETLKLECETVDQVREKLVKQGHEILDKDHIIVKNDKNG